MRTFCCCALIVAGFALAQGQWVRTGNLAGDTITAFGATSARTFASTSHDTYVALDPGGNWTPAGSMLPAFSSFAANGPSAFAGGGTGLYRTGDDGAHWDQINPAIDGWGGVMDAGRSNLLVNAGMLFAAQGGVYRSTDNGTSWQVLMAAFPPSQVHPNSFRGVAAIGTTLFTGTPYYMLSCVRMFRSPNNGETWTELTYQPCIGNTTVLGLYAVDARLFAYMTGGGLWRSSDFGVNWTQVGNGPGGTPCYALTAAGSTIFACATNGVYSSTNYGTTWTNINTGMASTSSYVRALMVRGGYLYAGTVDGLWKRALSEVMTSILVDLRVMLQGPFSDPAGVMGNVLATGGVLAGHFPGMAVPTRAVDSITVEIRDSAAAARATRLLSMPAWLLTDGTVCGFADSSKAFVSFTAPAGFYHIVVRHRNHLGAMTRDSVYLAGSSPRYDFCAAQERAYGANALILLASGVYGLVAGDANQSGIVTAADANHLFGYLNQTGYRSGDVNLTGIVTAADANMVFGNLNRAETIP